MVEFQDHDIPLSAVGAASFGLIASDPQRLSNAVFSNYLRALLGVTRRHDIYEELRAS